MSQIADLVGLCHNRSYTQISIERIAQTKLSELVRRITASREMQQTLLRLMLGCHGDARRQCLIRRNLADH